MEHPKISEEYLTAGSFFDIYNDEDFLLSNLSLKNELIERQSIRHPVLEQTILDHVTFSECDFEKFELTDVIFQNCDLSNCHFEEASIFRVEFKNCKMLGTTFDSSFMNNVIFQDCLMDLSNLNRLILKTVQFRNDSLKDSSFNDNKLTKTIFQNCDLNNMLCLNTPLKGIDISSCSFDSIELDQNFLRGLKVNREQAAYLASNFLNIEIS